MRIRNFSYWNVLALVLCIYLHSAASIYIESQQKPEAEQLFDLSLKTQNAKEQTNYKLKCMVKVQAVTFWTVDGKVPDGTKFKILPDSNLLIRNITQEDFEREYFCHAIILGRTNVESMQIILEPRREGRLLELEPAGENMLSRSEKIYSFVGELKTLSCKVNARPYPDFKWLHKNGTLIQNKTDFIISSYEDVSNLTILMRTANYYGEFFCEAWNNYGKTVMRFLVEMPEKPEGMPFIFPKSIGTNKIVLGVKFLESSKNYSIHVQYQKVSDLEWSGASLNKSDESLSLFNLQPNTTYLIKAAFKSEFVLGDYSEAIRITTDKIHLSKNDGNLIETSQNIQPLSPQGRSFSNNDKGNGQLLIDVESSKVINTTAWTSTKIIHSGKKIFIKTTTVEEIGNDFL